MLPPTIKPLSFNWSTSRAGRKVEAIIMHGTVGTDSRAYLSRGGDLPDGSDRKVSIHYLIPKPGEPVYSYVPEDRGANHAGFGTMPKGFTQVNPNLTTIGVELENLQNGKDPYPDSQLLAMGWIVNDIRNRHGALPTFRHADIDPRRRTDPVHLSVAEIEAWCVRAAAHYAPPATAYRALAPMWISETPTPYGPIAFKGVAVLERDEVVMIDEVKSGIAHIASGIGFVPIGGLEKL